MRVELNKICREGLKVAVEDGSEVFSCNYCINDKMLS